MLATLLLFARAPAWGETSLRGVVVEVGAHSISLRSYGDGRLVKLKLSRHSKIELSHPRPGLGTLQKGDVVTAITAGSPPVARLLRQLPSDRLTLTWGHIHSVDPSRRRLTMQDSKGLKVFLVGPGTAVFKDNSSANWLNLHQGQPAVVRAVGGNPPTALVILDRISFLVRQFQPTYGRLLASGSVVDVSFNRAALDGSMTVENLDGKTTRVTFDRATRWHLGARFTSPEDFRDMDSLIFGQGHRARMVVGQLAIPFLFEATLMER